MVVGTVKENKVLRAQIENKGLTITRTMTKRPMRAKVYVFILLKKYIGTFKYLQAHLVSFSDQ